MPKNTLSSTSIPSRMRRDNPKIPAVVTRVGGRNSGGSSSKKRKENTTSPTGVSARRLDLMKAKLAERKRRQILVDIPTDRDGALAAMERYKEGVFKAKDSQSLFKGELEGKVRVIERLVEGFKDQVEELMRQFDGLKEGIDEVVSKYDAVEQDYFTALDALQEEKNTVAQYRGDLANAAIELELLHRSVPEDDNQAAAFSQARPGLY